LSAPELSANLTRIIACVPHLRNRRADQILNTIATLVAALRPPSRLHWVQNIFSFAQVSRGSAAGLQPEFGQGGCELDFPRWEVRRFSIPKNACIVKWLGCGIDKA
jgi:hypothetical protein